MASAIDGPALLSLRDAVKVYGEGDAAGARARRRRPRHPARRVRRHHRPLGLGQVDGDEHPRLPRSADRGRVPRSRAFPCRSSRPTCSRRSATRASASCSSSSTCSTRTSALENVAHAARLRGRPCTRATAARARGARRGRARGPRAARARTSSRAASSSASPSRARSSTTQRSCSPTSRPATSTRRWARRSCSCSPSLNHERGITVLDGHARPEAARPTRAAGALPRRAHRLRRTRGRRE